MSLVRGIVFDKDGTLFDFASTWEPWSYHFLQGLADGDTKREAEIAAVMGFDLVLKKFNPTSPFIASSSGEVAALLHPYFPDRSKAELLAHLDAEAEKAPQAAAVPLAPLLSNLRARGIALGVATNDSEAPARAHLAQADAEELFDFIAGYDSGHGAKPAPGQLIAFTEHCNLDPAQTVMVGDSTHDLHAGRAAGMQTVAVLTGVASEDVLAPLADVVLPDIGHLPAWLDR